MSLPEHSTVLRHLQTEIRRVEGSPAHEKSLEEQHCTIYNSSLKLGNQKASGDWEGEVVKAGQA